MGATAISLEHAPESQKKRRSRKALMQRVCVSVSEWCESTGISKPTAYRMMANGKLRFVQVSESRKIPTTEYTRLGLLPEEAA